MSSAEGASGQHQSQDVRSSAQQHQQEHNERQRGAGRGSKSRGKGGWPSGPGGRGARAAIAGLAGNPPDSRSQGKWERTPVPLPAETARQFGVIVTVKETFGFIKCYSGRRDQVFFHGSELKTAPDADEGSKPPGRDLAAAIQPGTPVEFTIIEGDSSRRTVAVNVEVLPAFLDQVHHGTVERELRGGHKRREEAYGGRISWLSPLPLSRSGSAAVPEATPSAAAAHAAASVTAVEPPAPDRPPGLSNGTAAAAPQLQQLPQQQQQQQQPGQQPASASEQQQSQSEPGQPQQQPQRQMIGLPFEGGDMGEGTTRLHVGDEVSFRVTHDRRTGQLKATEISLVNAAHPPPPDQRPVGNVGKRENGNIVALKENFGFIRCADRDHRVFFHFSEAGFPKRDLIEGAEVSFGCVVDESTGRESAVALQLLPPGTIAASADGELPGKFHGRVVRPAQEPRSKQVQDGVAAFPDDSGVEFHCAFGNHQVPEGTGAPGEGDELEMTIISNHRTSARRASAVQLIARASERRELGKISTLKNTWGLIKTVDRSVDVFFHFSNVSEGTDSGSLKVGDDVQCTVTRDPETKKLAAYGVTRAPAGSAVFESVSDDVIEGTVAERLSSNKGVTVSSGIIDYTDKEGAAARLAFGLRDLRDASINPAVGEPVTFRLALNLAAVKAAQKVGGRAAAHAGRRATQVGPPVVAGTVATLKGSFGFAELQAAAVEKLGLGEHSRMFFHTSEVQDNVKLQVGDEVELVVTVNPRTGERNGRHVRRTKEAPPSDSPPQPEFVAERNPNAIRYTGNRVAQAVPMPTPKMPDGSKGFEAGAWCEKRMPQRPAPPPAQPPPAEEPQPAAAAAQPPQTAAAAPSAFASQADAAAAPVLPQPAGDARPPLPPGHSRRPSSVGRVSSGQLKANAPAFVPRAASIGASDAADISAAASAAVAAADSAAAGSRSSFAADSLQSRPPEAEGFFTPAASLDAAAAAELALTLGQQQQAQQEQQPQHSRHASLPSAPSDTFFTPSASLARPVDSAADAAIDQLQVVAAQLKQTQLEQAAAAGDEASDSSGSVAPAAEAAADDTKTPSAAPAAEHGGGSSAPDAEAAVAAAADEAEEAHAA